MTWDNDPEYLELRASYIASLAERKAALESASDRGDEKEIRGIAHKIAGSAASYGFPKAGEIASRIEDLDPGSSKLKGLAQELILALEEALTSSAGPRSAGAKNGSS